MLSANLSFEVSRETLVDAGLWWLFVGSLIWCFLDGTGVIKGVYAARCAKTDTAEARRYTVWASVFIIIVWPHYLWRLARPFLRRRAA